MGIEFNIWRFDVNDNDRERRWYVAKELRIVRAEGEGENQPAMIRGHAAVFDQLSVDLWGFKEKIAPGAFTATIKDDDIRALWNHDNSVVLGRNTAGTLRLSEDKDGLAIEIDVPDTQAGRDAVVTIERGDVSEMSFGFRAEEESWVDQDDPDKTPIRTLEKVKLLDVAPVTYPAYPDTDVAVRSLESARAPDAADKAKAAHAYRTRQLDLAEAENR